MNKLLIVPGTRHSYSSSYLALIPSFFLKGKNEKEEEGEEYDGESYDFRGNTFSDIVSLSLRLNILPIAILRRPSGEFDIDKATHNYVVCVPDGNFYFFCF